MLAKQADPSPTLLGALQLHQQGKLDQAETVYADLLFAQPHHFAALHMLGLLRSQQGRNAEALRYLRTALKVMPLNAAVLSDMGRIQAKLGRLRDALESFERALAFAPNHLVTLHNRGDVLLDLKRPEEALASYDKALALKPDYVEVLVHRGNTLRSLKRPEEALASYDKALAFKPGHPDILINRGNALVDLKRLEEALADYSETLAIEPDYPQALVNHGNVLKELKQSEQALSSYDRALALNPNYAEAYNNKGVVLMELGRLDEAHSAIKRAIALAPKTARFYFNLTASYRLLRGDPHIRAMEALARDKALLTEHEQVDLHFALGKAYTDIGDSERSFRYLLSGNALKRLQTLYDETAALGFLDRIRAAFSGDVMRDRQGRGDLSSLPVFIVGMPRSGTTLIEQILSSHPKVFGAGEIDDFDVAIGGLGFTDKEAPDFPDILSRLSSEQLRQLGASYLARIKDAAPMAARISNKTPENFRFAGLIHLALPNAHIIHVRRNPIDTCFSCFSKRFVDNLPYTYNLAELGRYYRAYERVMEHWRNALPPKAMLEVQYEDVVADLEGQARRIVAYCGLEWDARCLDFHRTKRPVRTASATQVRQPIYKSSVDRWRAYESFLGPLLAELKLPS